MPKPNYKELSDRELVELIVATQHNEEAVYFLLYDRYRALLFSIYQYYFGKSYYWFDDCMQELFLSLRGAEGNWNSFANFGWRAKMSTWLTKVAENKFLDCYYKMIVKAGQATSNDNGNGPKYPIDSGRAIMMIELMEAIGKLDDENQKFCMLKHLEGYNHKEIADMLKQKWDKEGTVVYNKKKEIVIPSEGFVNVRLQRAKEELRELMLGPK